MAQTDLINEGLLADYHDELMETHIAGGCVFDISAYHATGEPPVLAEYADLAAALGTDGANIPEPLRKGGMSVKFVQSSGNKYVQYRLMTDSWSIDTNDWSFCGDSVYVENPEWIYVLLDAEKRILAGLKPDGSVEWAVGVPTPVKTYIAEAIAEIKNGTEGTGIDGLNKIIAFLSEFSTSDTLKDLLDTKVDKEEDKSLINAEYASSIQFIENSEFIEVHLDAEDNILWAVKTDGSIYYGAGIPPQVIDYIQQKIDELSLDEYEDIVTFLDGLEEGDTTLRTMLTNLNTAIDNEVIRATTAEDTKVDKVAGKSLIDTGYAESMSSVENPEFISAETDNGNKILSARKADGTKIENSDAIFNKTLSISNTVELGKFEDIEDRFEVKTDAKNKVLSYRDKSGMLHEEGGVCTPDLEVEKTLKVNGGLELSKDASNTISKVERGYESPNLPKYGLINIKTETFYLTSNPNVSDINDVIPIVDVADTSATAADRMTIAHYYVKSTLTDNGDGTYSINNNSIRLRHYASGRVSLNSEDNKYYAKETIRLVNSVWYYADTLGYNGNVRNKVISGYSVAYTGDAPASGSYATVYTEVTQIVGPVCVNAWTVEDWDFNAVSGTDIGKKYGHNCICDVNFGHYYTKTNVAIEVKHQGNSTQGYRKRNYRFTFYKNSTFAKKDKKKFGEMLRLSKFNLKANWSDNSRIKELILYRIFREIWQHRPITDRYNWDGGINGYYHGSTGNIQGFPVRLNVNDEFYGIYEFTIPKDGKNYIIDDKDESTGMIISGSGNGANNWGENLPYNPLHYYESEMDNDLESYPGIIAAITEWTHFINNRLYVGSDNNYYNCTELTFFYNGTAYQYTDVTVEDNVVVLASDTSVEIDNIYVTSSLDDGAIVDSSISAELVAFNRDNIPSRLDVLGWIDYLICMQLFVCNDNQHNNMMFYAGSEKKKIYPYFYDLDLAIQSTGIYTYDCDIFDDGVSLSQDMTLWEHLRDTYWDEIVNRYCELRKTYLSVYYIESVYNDIAGSIPSADYISESGKWGSQINSSNFESKLSYLKKRLEYLDNTYFKI